LRPLGRFLKRRGSPAVDENQGCSEERADTECGIFRLPPEPIEDRRGVIVAKEFRGTPPRDKEEEGHGRHLAEAPACLTAGGTAEAKTKSAKNQKCDGDSE